MALQQVAGLRRFIRVAEPRNRRAGSRDRILIVRKFGYVLYHRLNLL